MGLQGARGHRAPWQTIFEVEVSFFWEIDFMGPFLPLVEKSTFL